jgi:hypothetical protein
MASTTLLKLTPSTFGDLSSRDLYGRSTYLRHTGDVVQATYHLGSSGPINLVTTVSSLTSSSGGIIKTFLKSSSGTIQTGSDVPVMALSQEQIALAAPTVSTTGKVTVKDVTLEQSSTNFNHDMGGEVNKFRFRDSSGNVLFEIGNDGSVSVAGIFTSESDALVTGDLYTTGDTLLYGSLNVSKTMTVKGDSILVGTNSTTSFADAGLYVGTTTSAAVASLVYQTTPTLTSTQAWVATVPLIYEGSARTAQLGTAEGNISVWKNDKSETTTLTSSALEFNSLWRLRYDSADNVMVFEYRSTTLDPYQTVSQLRPPS